MRFKHLNVPDQWQHYWTKYPEGYTILEALVSWVSQVDDMVDNVNDWNTYLDSFVDQFDTNLQNTVATILDDWNTTGFLAELINEYTNERIDDVETAITTKVDKTGVGQVSWANLSQEAKNNIAGDTTAIVGDNSVYTDAIIDGQVTPIKTSFVNEATISNLWNIDKLRDGQINRLTGGIITSDIFKHMDYVSVEGQTHITFKNYDSSTTLNSTYAFYSAESVDTYISGGSQLGDGTILIPQSALFWRVSVRLDFAPEDKIQINFGETADELSAPYYELQENIKINNENIEENTITSEKINNIHPDKLSMVSFLENQEVKDYEFKPYSQYRNTSNDGKTWSGSGQIVGGQYTTNYTATHRIPVFSGVVYRAKARNYLIFDENDILLEFIDNPGMIYREITIPENGAKLATSPLITEANENYGLTRITPLVTEKTFNIPNLQNSISRFSGKKLVAFGDSITANYPEITQTISTRLGFEVINVAIGGAKMAEREGVQMTGGGHTANSGVRIAEQLLNNDFSDAREYSEAWYSGGTLTRILESIERLETTDFDSVDFALIFFGANDYLQSIPIGTITSDRYTYMGAYRIFIETLQSINPNINLILASPIINYSTPPADFEISDYVEATIEIANYFNLPYIDNYSNAGVNTANRLAFFSSTDPTHPSSAGRTHYGNRIASGIELNF